VAIQPPGTPNEWVQQPSLRDPNCSPTASVPRVWGLVECGRTLYRHKLALLSIAGIGILSAALFTMLQPRLYQSHAAIQIQGINENFLSLRDIYPTAAPSGDNAVYIQTQAEMLRQDALIQQVVRKLRLEQRAEFQGTSRLSETPDRNEGDQLSALSEWTAIRKVKKNLRVIPSRGTSIIQIVCSARDPQLAAAIANTLAQIFIDQNIGSRQRAAKQTYASLSLVLEELKKRLAKSEARLDTYDRALWLGAGAPKLRLDSDRQFYEFISRRADEARVASSVRQANVSLVSPAEPAAHPYKPNPLLNLLVGAFAGLALGVGYVMLREQTSSVLRAPGEAGVYLTLPELGAIPKATNGGLSPLSLAGTHGPVPVERAYLDQSSSGVSESFRATVASILSAGQNGHHPRTLIVTSSRPMEGKTTVVSNLAIGFAEIGKKVLLIDGDLRRPRLHNVFDQANSWGLSDLLREKNAIEELPLEALVKRTAVPHLYLLPSGTCASNIFGLLWSDRMARLLPRFRQEFDCVLMDAPPCLEFADARIMSRYAEKLLLVVRANYTEITTARAAVQRLLLDGIPVMGVIVNCWDPSHSDVYAYARCRQD
jgi:polysaccharide biosynthesis transport protein